MAAHPKPFSFSQLLGGSAKSLAGVQEGAGGSREPSLYPFLTREERGFISLLDACMRSVIVSSFSRTGGDLPELPPFGFALGCSFILKNPAFALEVQVLRLLPLSLVERRAGVSAMASFVGSCIHFRDRFLNKRSDWKIPALDRAKMGLVLDSGSMREEALLSAAAALGLPMNPGLITNSSGFRFGVGGEFGRIAAAKSSVDLSGELPALVQRTFSLASQLRGIDDERLLNDWAMRGTFWGASRSDESLDRHKRALAALGVLLSDMAGLLESSHDVEKAVLEAGCGNVAEVIERGLSAGHARMERCRAEFAEGEKLESVRLERSLAQRAEEERREAESVAAAERVRQQRDEAAQRAALARFHGRFQEVPLSPESERVLEMLEGGDALPVAVRARARLVGRVVQPLRRMLFDWRGDEPRSAGDPAIERLSQTVFSPANIGMAARALGIDVEKCLQLKLPARSPVEGAVREVSGLFASSRAARRIIMTMLDQSDGVLLLATIALPAAEPLKYATERDWNAHGVDRLGRNLLAPLAARIRRVLEDGIVLKAARERLGPLEPRKPTEREVIEIPEWVKNTVNRGEFACSLEDGQLLVALREAPSLAIYLPAKSLRSEEVFRKEFKLKLDELLSSLEVERALGRLQEQAGFEVKRIQGEGEPEVELSHPEYGISCRLTGLCKRWLPQLELIEQQHQQHEQSWRVLLRRAEGNGFTVERGPEGVTCRHELVGERRLSTTAFIPLRQLAVVSQLIEDARAAGARREQGVRRERNQQRRIGRVLQAEVLPGLGDEIVVVDANVFMLLAAPRPGGSTWLDLLSATAELNNVRMVVPAIVADFEITGRLQPFDGSDSGLLGRSLLGWASTDWHHMTRFLDDATRIKVGAGEDGRPAVIGARLGANRRLCLVESPGDEDLFNRVKAVVRQAGSDHQLLRQLLSERLYGRGEGDLAISRFLAACPFVNRVSVITSDIRYAKHQMPRSTGLGCPVSSFSAGSYIAAECANRAEELGELLNAGGPVEFYAVADDIQRHWLMTRGEEFSLFPFRKLGVAGPGMGLAPADLDEVLRQPE